MARILRGEIRWADLVPTRGNEQSERRPVLTLSVDIFNDRSGTVIGVALTSQAPRAGFPLTLELDSAKLSKVSWVKIGHIRTLSSWRASTRSWGPTQAVAATAFLSRRTHMLRGGRRMTQLRERDDVLDAIRAAAAKRGRPPSRAEFESVVEGAGPGSLQQAHQRLDRTGIAATLEVSR